jgi:hypothetical protein
MTMQGTKMRTTFTWDSGPSRAAQPTGCGYTVNLIYDGIPEQKAYEPIVIEPEIEPVAEDQTHES